MKIASTVLGVGIICVVIAINYRVTFGTADASSEASSSEKKIAVPMGRGREILSLSPKKESASFFVKRMKITAYCPCAKCCGKYSDGITAIGRNAHKTLGVAADPKLLPYRTALEIPNLGKRIVDDTGGAMRQSAKKGIWHIDVRFPTHQEALEWGVKWLDVKVYK